MGHRWRNLLYLCLLGAVAGLGVLAVAWIGRDTTARASVAASDFVFLAESGPCLGRRSASAEVVFVLFDGKSARDLGNLPTFDQDLDLYQALLDGGARVVADTRMIADSGGDETSDVRRLLDGMAAMQARGRLYRDIWTGADWAAERMQTYRPLIAHNLLNVHPNIDGFFESRVYPLASVATDGMHESMPLIVARAALKLERPDSAEVLAEIKRSGIAAAWQAGLPEGMSLPAAMQEEDAVPSPYSLGDRRIPWHPFPCQSSLVPPAAFWVSYARPPSGCARVSYVDAGEAAAAGQFDGKIVLVGYAAATDPSSDTYAVPCSPARVPAVEVVAAALVTLLEPRLMLPLPSWVVWSSVLLLACLAAVTGGSLRPLAAAGGVAVLLVVFAAASVVAYRAGWYADLVLAPCAILLGGGFGAGWRYWGEIRARMRITDLFGRYVPRAVVAHLVQQPDVEALAVGGIKREVTVLFADIRDFTPFAERLPPEEVLVQLNSLLRIMVDCTFAHEGTLDKFIGDAILVLFNAPLDQPDHTERAARTGLAIQQGLAGHESGLKVGIGIHRGEAVVGTVGTPQRMEYTAVGSTVNVASRLCAAAGSGQIVLSETAAEALGDRFELVPQEPIRVKGVESELRTSLLVGLRQEQ